MHITSLLCRLQNQLSTKRIAAAAAAGIDSGSDGSSFTLISSLGGNPGSRGDPAKVAAASTADSSSSSKGVQGVVVKASAATAARIKQSQLVAAVFADRVVKAQGACCQPGKCKMHHTSSSILSFLASVKQFSQAAIHIFTIYGMQAGQDNKLHSYLPKPPLLHRCLSHHGTVFLYAS